MPRDTAESVAQDRAVLGAMAGLIRPGEVVLTPTIAERVPELSRRDLANALRRLRVRGWTDRAPGHHGWVITRAGVREARGG
jgi:hypothetical protein